MTLTRFFSKTFIEMTCTGLFFVTKWQKFAPKNMLSLPPSSLDVLTDICKQTRGVSHCGLGIYSMKDGSLFYSVFLIMRSTKLGSSDHVLGVFGKLRTRRGAWAWFHDVWTCSAKVLNI